MVKLQLSSEVMRAPATLIVPKIIYSRRLRSLFLGEIAVKDSHNSDPTFAFHFKRLKSAIQIRACCWKTTLISESDVEQSIIESKGAMMRIRR